MTDTTKHFLVACATCGHVWSLTPLPIPLDQLAKTIGPSVCPNCRSTVDEHLLPTAEQAQAWAQQQDARQT